MYCLKSTKSKLSSMKFYFLLFLLLLYPLCGKSENIYDILDDMEYKANGIPFTLLNIHYLYEKNLTGENVVLGNIDGGLQVSLPDFEGRVHLRSGVIDTTGHPTAVAMILVGNKNNINMQGIAYKSLVISDRPQRIFRNPELFIDAGVKVINISVVWNTRNHPPFYLRGIQKFIQNDMVIVCSTGNWGPDSGVYFPASYALQARGAILAVSSATISKKQKHAIRDELDFSPRIEREDIGQYASFSQWATPCKEVAEFCVIAPGEGINTLDTEDSPSPNTGTSLSAPMVAGIITLLRQAYPEAKNHEVVEAILETAVDIGQPGTDWQTGRGFPDALAAFEYLAQRHILHTEHASPTSSVPDYHTERTKYNNRTPNILGDFYKQYEPTEFYETIEYQNNKHPLSSIKLPFVYAYGLTGKGITIGIVGGAVNDTLRELKTQLHPLSLHQSITRKEPQGETFLTSIMVASRGREMLLAKEKEKQQGYLHGVAFDSSVFMLPSLSPSGLKMLEKANVKVLLLPTRSNHTAEEIQKLLEKDIVVVVSSSYYLPPEIDSPKILIVRGRLQKQTSMNHFQYDFVEDTIELIGEPFSSSTKKTSKLTAPQGMIGIRGDGRFESRGYSEYHLDAAAAVAAGVAALLRQAFPQKTAQEITALMTKSALDLGEKGLDAAYGSGFLDSEKALRLGIDD